MGLIGTIFGTPAATTAIGNAASTVAEVFVPNATKKMQAAQDAYMAALDDMEPSSSMPRPVPSTVSSTA